MWKDLSMQQRADLMDIYLSHGISSLDEMRNHYDSRNQFANGGNLFSGEDEPTQQMNSGLNLYRRTNNLGETEYIYQETPDSEEILLTPTNKRFSDDPSNWDYKDASGREYSPRMASPISSSTLEASEKMGPLEKYVAELNWRTKNDPASIALQGKYTMPAIAAAPFLTWAGEAAYPYVSAALANPYVDAGLTSAFAGHGLNHAINEGIDGYGDAAMTTLEIAPLGGLAKSLWKAGRNSLGLLKDDAKAFYNNLTMDLNSVPGRFYHGSPSRTIEEFIPGDSGGIYFTPTKKAARGYTGSLGTGRVYEANLNLGNSPVVVDARGKAWNAIPEEEVAKAFGMPKEEIYEQIGHYNAGAEPWYSDFLKPFGYNPNTRSYAVDQIVTLGKDLGKSSLTIKGAKDSGKGLFGWKQLPYDQTVVYSPEQVSLLKSAPQITAKNAAKNSSIMADANDFSYKGLTSDMSDFFEKMTYSNKIHGKPMVPSDEGVGGFSKSVQVGIPKTEYDELLHDVVGRNIREFKRAGLSDAQVSNYINNSKDAMDNVRIGMYSNSDYIKGGWEGFGGFYDSEGNFISVNTGSPLSKTKVVKHEGRHLLDHKVDDVILMPASENFGKDFDSDIALSTMQKVKQNQNMTLYDAYDNDFMTLPSKEGFNEGLEGYSNMDREAITTNLDSRNELLGSKAGWDLDITDKIIDKMPDTAIFEAVEKANGYGRRYIRFLRDNNKLTPQKAQQFREAMKHVGAYAIPTAIAAGTLYGKQE